MSKRRCHQKRSLHKMAIRDDLDVEMYHAAALWDYYSSALTLGKNQYYHKMSLQKLQSVKDDIMTRGKIEHHAIFKDNDVTVMFTDSNTSKVNSMKENTTDYQWFLYHKMVANKSRNPKHVALAIKLAKDPAFAVILNGKSNESMHNDCKTFLMEH